MEKVMCIKCGSIGYTAAPEHVLCSECGGKHKVIDPGYKEPSRLNRILSLMGGLVKG